MKTIGYLVSRILKLLIWSNSNNRKSTWDQRLIAYQKLDSPGCQVAIGALVLIGIIIIGIIAVVNAIQNSSTI